MVFAIDQYPDKTSYVSVVPIVGTTEE